MSADDTDYEEGDRRAVLNKPFIQGNCVVASNGHRIVTFPLDLFETPPTNIKSDFPNVERVFKKFEEHAKEIPVVINLTEIEGLLSRVPRTRFRYCEECGGEGKVDYTYEAETNDCVYTETLPCPVCNGAKIIEVDEYQAEDYPIYIEGRMVLSNLLKWLAEVMQRLGWRFIDYYGSNGVGAYFKKDGIRLAITDVYADTTFEELVGGYNFGETPELVLVK